MKTSRKVMAFILSALIIFSTFMLYSCNSAAAMLKTVKDNPYESINNSLAKSIGAFCGVDEATIFELMSSQDYNNLLQKYKNVITDIVMEIQGMPVNISQAFDIQEGKYYINASMLIYDAALAIDNEKIIISSESLTDGEAFGMLFENFAENLASSDLGKMLGIDENTASEIEKYFESFKSMTLEENNEDIIKAAEDFEADIIELTEKYFVSAEEAKVNTISGEKEVIAVKYTYGKEFLEKALDMYIEYMEECYSGYEDAFGAYGLTGFSVTGQLEENIKETLDEIDEYTIDMNTYIEPKSGKALLINVDFDLTVEDEKYNINASIDFSDSNKIIVELTLLENGEEPIEYGLEITKEASKTDLTYSLAAYSYDDDKAKENNLTATLYYVFESGEYTFEFNSADEESAVITGSVKSDDNVFNMIIDKINYVADGVKEDIMTKFDITVTLDGEMPQMPTEYKNIFDLSEDDLEKIIEDISSKLTLPEMSMS